jgi:hypothetical protein
MAIFGGRKRKREEAEAQEFQRQLAQAQGYAEPLRDNPIPAPGARQQAAAFQPRPEQTPDVRPTYDYAGGWTGRTEEARALGERMGAEAMARAADPDGAAAEPAGGGTPTVYHQQRVTDKDLAKATETLLKYKAAKNSVDRRIIESQEWWKMHNWQQIEAERGTKGSHTKKSSTGWLWNAIVGKHADAMDAYPEPIILPRMQDDKGEAKQLTDIIPVILKLNDFEETYSQVQWQKNQEGTGGYGVFWDQSKLGGIGDIEIPKINILNLYWEPGVTDIQKSRNLFYVTLVSNEQLEEEHPELQGKLGGEALSVSQYMYDDHVDITDKSFVIDWYYKKWVNGRRVLHYCQYVGTHILYASENDLEPGPDGISMADRGWYDDGEYPFVLDPLFPVEGSPAGFGYITVGKDTQMDIDTINQALVRNAVVSATPRYFARKDGGVNEAEFLDWSKPIVHVNGNLGQDSLRVVETTPLGTNAMNMLTNKIDELKTITGNTDVQNGGTPSGVTAASAIAALQEYSGRSSKDASRASYRVYSRLITMVIERIRQFYTAARTFRIVGSDGREQFVDYSNAGLRIQEERSGFGLPNGYRLPEFDIDVRTQRETAYTKLAQNELALQFYGAGMLNPANVDVSLLALDMMDFKGKEELEQKLREMGTLRDQMAQMAQIAQQMALQAGNQDVAMQIQAIMAQSPGAAQQLPASGQMPTPETAEMQNSLEPRQMQKARMQSQQAALPT